MRMLFILLPPVGLLLLPLAAGLLARWRVRRRRAVAFVAAFTATAVFLGLGLTLTPPRLIRAAPHGAEASADSFVVFSFGMGPTVNGRDTPGQSNRALARWVVEHNPARKPTVVQEYIYLAFQELETGDPGLRINDWVIRLPHRPSANVDTFGGALQADAILVFKGCARPVIVAHDLQLQRATWTFERCGREDFVVPELPPTPFDPASVDHEGTRYQSAWMLRELLFARPMTLTSRTAGLAAGGLVALLYLAAALWVTRQPRHAVTR